MLVSLADHHAALALAGYLRGQLPGVTDVVSGATSVLVDGLGPARDRLARLLDSWPGPGTGTAGPVVRIGVDYDGADLSRVADLWQVSEEEVVRRHTGVEFLAAFTGFAPGFAYLSGSPWPVPRLATPRPRVPAGAVALADSWCGIYPRPSPGGWQLIGRTTTVLWDLDRDPPAVLAPGTRVRFEAR